MRPPTLLFAGLSLIAVAFPLVGPGVGVAAAEEAETGIRLGRDVVPTFQFVDLVLDADQTRYTGSVRCDLDVRKATTSFRFHAYEMDLSEIVLEGDAGRITLEHTTDGDGTVTVTASRTIPQGSYTLTVDFDNEFDTRAVGLYRMEAEGHGYLFTQFEAIDGRKAFPCWDEPSFKIPYQMQLTVPAHHEAVANTPVAEETERDGHRVLLFERTKPMPSYLLAIATGPFDSVPIPGLQVPGKIYTIKDRSHLTGMAASMTAPILAALEDYFGSPYPYKKLDFIAVPEFWYGAMENVGAVTFSEPILALDPETSSFAQRRRLGEVIAHELAHMWFGNLVTLDWWDDLWLNEAFAYWMGERIPDQVYPEFRYQVHGLRNTQWAMLTDALPTSRAIRQPVTDLPNLLQSSDVLTNHKGKAVIGMFEQWLGPEVFQRGLRDYLKTHAWGNATGSDFWAAMSAAAGSDLAPSLSSFFDHAGMPLVSAEVLDGGKVRLTQRRFLHHGVPDPTPEHRWHIPVMLRYSDGTELHSQKVMLAGRSHVVFLENGATPEWIHLNAGQAGYYHWAVEPALLERLAHEAVEAMSFRERVGFIGNLAALLDSGHLDGADYLRTLRVFGDDPEPEVVDAMLRGLGKVRSAFVTEGLDTAFAGYVRQALAPAVERFGMEKKEGEIEAVSLVRPDLLWWLGDAGRDEAIIAYGEEMARRYLDDSASVDPALSGTFLHLAALRGDHALFEAYKQRFESAKVPADRGRFLGAMGSFRDPEIVGAALAYALEGPLRPQEIFSTARSLPSYPPWNEIGYTWMTEHYDTIATRVPPMFLSFMPYFAAGCSSELLGQAQAFFADREGEAPGTQAELAKVAAGVTSCVGLREREGESVRAYLEGASAEMD